MSDWLAERLTGGEPRLSLFDAVALVRLREPMSVARAQAVVRTALGSGEIRRDRLRGWYSKDDFLDWLDRQYPVTKTTAPASPSKSKGNSRPKSKVAHRKAAVKEERTKQAIKAKCSTNGELALSKEDRTSLGAALKVSPSTISRALRKLRDEQSKSRRRSKSTIRSNTI